MSLTMASSYRQNLFYLPMTSGNALDYSKIRGGPRGGGGCSSNKLLFSAITEQTFSFKIRKAGYLFPKTIKVGQTDRCKYNEINWGFRLSLCIYRLNCARITP